MLTITEYARKVREMREWQHRYLSGRDRSSFTLQKCKTLEADVDGLTNKILGSSPETPKPQATQTGLFP